MRRIPAILPLAMTVVLSAPFLHGCIVERFLNVDVSPYGPDLFLSVSLNVLFLALVIAVLVYNRRQRNLHRQEIDRCHRELQLKDDRTAELTAQIQEAARTRLTFLNNAAADILKPLELVDATVSDIAGETTGHTYERLERASRNIKALLRLTGGILNLRASGADNIYIAPVPVDLRAEIQRWSETFRREAMEKHLRFKVSISHADDYSIKLDPEKLECVFFNLMSIAFRASTPGAEVAVNVRRAFDHAAFTIDFNTPTPDKRDELINTFARFTGPESMPSNDAGIGLVISRLLLELHGGSLAIEPGDSPIAVRIEAKLPIM